MLVKSVRNEIINLATAREYTLNRDVLVIKENGVSRKYTLTKESAVQLANYLEANVR